jgi:hypothetical protein
MVNEMLAGSNKNRQHVVVQASRRHFFHHGKRDAWATIPSPSRRMTNENVISNVISPVVP